MYGAQLANRMQGHRCCVKPGPTERFQRSGESLVTCKSPVKGLKASRMRSIAVEGA